MKFIVAIFALVCASHAHAGTVTIQPGQCVLVGTTNVCASSGAVSQPYYPSHPPTVVVESVQELAPYAYCRMTEGRSPNVWELWRQGGTTKHRLNAFVKTFPHFDGSKCQAEADRINQRS